MRVLSIMRGMRAGVSQHTMVFDWIDDLALHLTGAVIGNARFSRQTGPGQHQDASLALGNDVRNPHHLHTTTCARWHSSPLQRACNIRGHGWGGCGGGTATYVVMGGVGCGGNRLLHRSARDDRVRDLASGVWPEARVRGPPSRRGAGSCRGHTPYLHIARAVTSELVPRNFERQVPTFPKPMTLRTEVHLKHFGKRDHWRKFQGRTYLPASSFCMEQI